MTPRSQIIIGDFPGKQDNPGEMSVLRSEEKSRQTINRRLSGGQLSPNDKGQANKSIKLITPKNNNKVAPIGGSKNGSHNKISSRTNSRAGSRTDSRTKI